MHGTIPKQPPQDVALVGSTRAGSNGTLPVRLIHNGDACTSCLLSAQDWCKLSPKLVDNTHHQWQICQYHLMPGRSKQYGGDVHG